MSKTVALTSQILLSSEGVKWHISKQINSVISSSDEGMTEAKQVREHSCLNPESRQHLRAVSATNCNLSLALAMYLWVFPNWH